MSKLGTIDLQGQSGQKYTFNIYKWGAELKDIGAVYYISNRQENADGSWSHTNIYVGQTEDMSERFDNHHKAECFDSYNVSAISIHQEEGEDSRLEIEDDLITALDPPCNG